MSRPCDPGVRPAVTSWFLLALTALAALLGSGLEVGGPAAAATRELAAADAGSPERSTSPEQSTGATDARVPFIGAAVGGTAAPAAGAPSDAATAGSSALLAPPLGLLAQAPAQAVAPSYVLVGGSGRAPPVTSGT